jgi:hypothetical protein
MLALAGRPGRGGDVSDSDDVGGKLDPRSIEE